MMRSTISAIAATVLGLFPVTAVAYLTPEQVLLQQQSQYMYQESSRPPSRRTIEEQQKERDRERVQQHIDGQAALTGKAKGTQSSHGAVPEQTANEEVTIKSGQTTITIDPITLRLLERIQDQQNTRALIQKLNLEGLTDGLMHGGAPLQRKPLAPTGLPEAAAAALGMLAIACTWRSVLRMDRTHPVRSV